MHNRAYAYRQQSNIEGNTMTDSKPNVLITGCALPAAISFFKSLDPDKFTFFMLDRDPYASGLYLVPSARRIVLKPTEEKSYTNCLLEACKAHAINLLVPTLDEELMDISKRVDEFEKIGCKVLIAKHETIELCEDKYQLLKKVEHLFPSHDYISYDQNVNVHELPLPMAMKPRKASDGREVICIESKTQLQTYKRDGSYYLQSYLPGQEYSVDVYRNRSGEILACVPRARLKIEQGVVITGESRNHQKLIELTSQIAHAIDLFGVANIQFKENGQGDAILMEINVRFPASMTLTVQSGANIPQIFVDEVLYEKTSHDLIPVKEVAMTRFFQEVYFEPREMLSR
jgi:carbamoyl-phosphate synthase large subunit